MQLKTVITLIGFVFFLNTFYGCSGLTKEPITKHYFDISVDLIKSNQKNISIDRTILIKEFDINPVFNSYSFVYRIRKNEYINDYYNEFINYPAKLITEKIKEGLWSSPYFTPGSAGKGQNIEFWLSGKIIKLYGDFQEPDHPKAVIEIRMNLGKKADNTLTSVYSKTYLAIKDIPSRDPAHLVSGWNNGLSKILTQFIYDFKLLYPKGS